MVACPLKECRVGLPAARGQAYPTEGIYQLFVKSKSSHKIVSLLFTITNENIELTVLWGACRFKTNWDIKMTVQFIKGTHR
jgi:hypothetical protein